jgi:hypothetical protein
MLLPPNRVVLAIVMLELAAMVNVEAQQYRPLESDTEEKGAAESPILRFTWVEASSSAPIWIAMCLLSLGCME